MATRTGLQTRPLWGAYSIEHIGASYILDDANGYALTFPLSVNVGSVRHTGVFDYGQKDEYWYCDRFSPDGYYWRLAYDLTKFGLNDGKIYVETFIYSPTCIVRKIYIENTSNQQITVELSQLGSAWANMVSYSSGLVQNDIYSAVSNYIGMSWSTQSTKAAVICCSDTMTHQDIKDSNYTVALDSASDPYTGNSLGRTVRGKVSKTVAAGANATVVFTIAVEADEATAYSTANGALSGYATPLLNAQNKYQSQKSVLCNARFADDTTESPYGDLVERILAGIQHNIVYFGDGADSNKRKLTILPGRNWTDYWYAWDNGATAIGLSEAGYNHLAKDVMNYAFDSGGSYVYNVYTNPPILWLAAWKIYQNGAKDVLTSYYTALKAAYNFNKSFMATGSYYKWEQGWESGMEDMPVWNPMSGSQSTVTPCAVSYLLFQAYYMNKMAVVLGNTSDSTTFLADIETFKTSLELLWDSTDLQYYSIVSSSDTTKIKTKIVSNILPLIFPNTPRKSQLITNLNAFLDRGNVMSMDPSDPEFTNHHWVGPSWYVINYLIYNGLRESGETELAKQLEKQALQIWNGTGNYTLRELKNVGEDFLNGVRQFVSFTSMIIDTVTDQPKKRRIVV